MLNDQSWISSKHNAVLIMTLSCSEGNHNMQITSILIVGDIST
jgi:hypothetical protein